MLSPYLFCGLTPAGMRQHLVRTGLQRLDLQRVSDDPDAFVKHLVCERMGISVVDLESKCRKRHYVLARRMHVTLMRAFSSYTYTRIASTLNRDHSTIMYQHDAMLDDLEVGNYPAEVYRELHAQLEAVIEEQEQEQ
jgi:chromosomal replication initiation ATPase DnaA